MISLQYYAGNTPIEKAKADFKKMNSVYDLTPTFSLDIQYCVFDNHVNGNLVENKSGKYFKVNNQSYTKLLNIETIVNAKNTIVVNHEDKVIVITDTKKIELSPIQTNMDTLLKLCKSIRAVDLGVTERHYILEFDDDEYSEFSQIDIYINLTNYSIKKLVLFYNQTLPLDQNDYYAEEKKPRLEITYKTFKKIANVTPAITELFNEPNYLIVFGDSYKCSNKYSNYKVINQISAYRFKKK